MNRIILAVISFLLFFTGFINIISPFQSRASTSIDDYFDNANSPVQSILGDQYLNGDFVSLRFTKINGKEISSDLSELIDIGKSQETDLDVQTSLCQITKTVDFTPQITEFENYSEILYRKDFFFEADIQVNTISSIQDLGFTPASVGIDCLNAYYKVTPEIQDDPTFNPVGCGTCGDSFTREYGEYEDWTSIGDMWSEFKYIEVKGGYYNGWVYYADGWRNYAAGFGITEPTPLTFQISINPSFASFPSSQVLNDNGDTITYIDGWAGIASAWNDGFSGGLISGQSNLITEPNPGVETDEYKEAEQGLPSISLPNPTDSPFSDPIPQETITGFSPITHEDAKGLISGFSYSSGGDAGVWEKSTKIEEEPFEIRGMPENSALNLRQGSEPLQILDNYQYDSSIVNYRADNVELDYIVQKCKPKTVMDLVEYHWSRRTVKIERVISYYYNWWTCGCQSKTDQGAKIFLSSIEEGDVPYLPYAYQIYDVYLRDKIQFRVPVFVKYKFENGEDVPLNSLDVNGALTTGIDSTTNYTLGTPYEISSDRVWTTGKGVFGDTNSSILLDTTSGSDWETTGGGLFDIFNQGADFLWTIIIIAIVGVVVFAVFVILRSYNRKSKLEYKARNRYIG